MAPHQEAKGQNWPGFAALGQNYAVICISAVAPGLSYLLSLLRGGHTILRPLSKADERKGLYTDQTFCFFWIVQLI